MLRRLGFNLPRYSAETFGQDLPEVPAGAVWAEKAQIVDVYVPGQVGAPDLLGIYLMEPIAHREGFPYVIVEPVYRLLRIRVFVYPPVLVIEVFGKHVGWSRR